MTPAIERMVGSMLEGNGRIVVMAALQEVPGEPGEWRLRVGIAPGLREMEGDTLQDIVATLHEGVVLALSRPLDDLTLLWSEG